MAAISLTDTPILLGSGRAFIGGHLIWAGSRVARVAAALLAVLAFGLAGASLARAASPQALTALTPSFITAGSGTARVVVSPDGKSVYATNKGTTTVSQYARNAVTGVLTALSPATVETGGMPEGVTVSPDGTSVYVANHLTNTVSQYSRNTTTGALAPLSPATVVAGTSPTGIAISADGKSVYIANSTSENVSQYSRNTVNGKLTPLSTATVPAGANAHGIVVSPDGKNVYETNYGAGNVSQYSRNTETGALTALSPATEAAGVNPHDLAISADGNNVYVADSSSPGAISQLSRNATTGLLAPLGKASVAAGQFTEGVVVSPDGIGVYATNEETGNISQYFRNTETGALAAQTPATVLAGSKPEGIAVSADGKNVYAADNGSSGISQYARNQEVPQPPAVLTGSASAVGSSSATLSGSVNPNSQEVTECRVEYGTTNGYGSIASCTSLPGSGSSPVAVSAPVTGLTASTTYHFRVVATNATGIGNGPDETFKTLSSGPTVVTKAASTIAQTTATLNATVNPNGNEVGECKLEYGSTEAYGASVPCSPAPGSGTSPVAVSGSAVGLTANTTYHFRIVATNAGGTGKGADETLKTLPNAPTVVTKAASALTQTTATLNATVNPNGSEVSECKLEYGTTNAYGSSATCAPSAGSGTSAVAVSAAITGLTANTTYHFRISATNAGGTGKGADETFKTLPNAPAVVTKAASAVTQTSATLNATVNPNGGEVSECRFEYGTTELYGSSVPCSSPPGSGSSPVAVSASLGAATLSENTTYHFRISATNAGGTSNDSDLTFKTLPNAPTVVTKAASAVTQTTATLNATVNPNGGEVTECKLEYGTTTAYGSSANCTSLPGSGTGPVAVSAPVTGLTANTTYHFRISATNAGGTGKDSDETLKTLPNAPTVETKAASAVTQTTATLNAAVNPNGGEVSECKLEYGTTNAYGSSASCTPSAGSGTSPVAVSASVGALSPNTTYHFRISATNAGGTGKGADETLKTPVSGPTVETKAASAVAQTTATLNATVNPNGGAVSECKLEYGTTTAYGSSASCTPSPGSGTSPVAVSASVTGLTANTTYHFRISATNAGATSKGADETFKTLPSAPAVVTKAASAVTQTSATLTATVNPNGGEVSECRFEYGTTELYGSTAPCSFLPGSGISPVAVSAPLALLSLSENTTYHFRISATNAGGASQGSDLTFKTLPNAPTVVTKAASAVTQTTATLNATVNPNGGEVTECKLEYGTTTAYGSSANCSAPPGSGGSPVAVSASVSGLSPNTTYHFRILATNAGGTAKDSDETLKTLPNAPTVETKAASSVTQTTAALNATVNPNGGEVSECKLEYGTTNAYGSTATCTPSAGSGTSPVAVSASVTGLTANTPYHFRITATNAGGTSKGEDGTLTTLPNAPAVVTKAGSSITQTSATLTATVNPNAGEVSECKLEYGTTTAYGSSATCTPPPGSGTSPVAVSASVGGLSPNTLYHFRISATNAGGTSKGSDEALTTLPKPPTVETQAASSITQTTASLNATVNPNGGEVGECQLEYGTTTAYGSTAPCASPPGSGTSPVTVSAAITGLTANTTYHVRISATNAGGTSTGSDETFKTLPNPPTVVTKAASSVTQTTATPNATVNPNGGEVGDCRVEYGATEAYGSSATCASLPGSGSSPVAVSASVSGLSPNTTYHFRISATNAGGTNKGADETLKTLPNAPTIETKAPSAVTQTTATLNATVNPNGGEVSECKLEYGTTNTYGSSAPCTPSPGSGTAPFAVSASVSGLSANTPYHFRISATNAGGTSKGADETLTTLPNAPTLETKAASAVTQTSATLNASVNPNGGEVGECRFEYGTTEAYGSTAPCSAPAGSGTSPVAVSASLGLVTLTENTTYHFRISATNAGGTSKGSDQTFKTLPNPPTVEAKPASAVAQTTATLNGAVNPNGGEVGECRFEYGTTTSYGSSASCAPSPGSGSSPVAVSASVGGLSPNTPYHFRIVAANAGGTSKGADETAKTLPNVPTVETKAASAVTQTSASLHASVNPNGGEVSECELEYGTTNAYGSTARCTPAPGSGTSPVAVSASLGLLTLTENTTYHFRISATNAGGTSSGADETFKTLPNGPAVEAKPASSVTQTTATLHGTVNPNGGEVGECRFEYGTTTAYGSSASCTPSPGSGSSAVAVSASVGSLGPNTPYHFRIVATNAGGTTIGSDEALTTLPNPPTVVTGAASSLTQTAATLNASVNPNGGEVSECKFEYGTTNAYGSSVPCASPPGSGTSPAAVSAAVTGLSANTTYHFRISATNAGGRNEGSDETLKTLPNAPAVVTGPASSLKQTTATLNASVNPNGGEVSECKFEYGTTNTYGSSAPCASSPGAGTSPVAVSASATGLSPNTTYHFRISATNAGGTNQGSDETLKTLPNAPTVETKAPSSVTQTTATLNAAVNPNSGEVSDCRVEYGTTEAYGSSASCSSAPGSGVIAVAVSASANGLSPNTTYHFRISATNAGGTNKGSDETLKTLPNAPALETKAASSLTQTTATLNATVNPNGGTVGDCHLEYGPTETYGTSVPCSPAPGSGASPVAVSASISGLTVNATYHFRIVATNAGGTEKGSDETLKTLPNPPTVVTDAASPPTQTTAGLNATVNPNGGEVSECKFEYGTTTAYGSSAPCTPAPGSGTSAVAVSASVTGLSASTVYHFRIVAKNAGGTSPGSDQTFETLPGPAVETKAASSVTQTTATFNAAVNPNGGEISDCHFEYGPTEAYGTNIPCSPAPGAGKTAVPVSVTVGGLSPNTAYHFRVVATNPGGTGKGSDEKLKTLPNPPTVVTEGASSVTQTSGTLNATVNPNGGEISECKLEYGTTGAYGSSVSCASLPGSGTSPVAVSASVGGLSPSTAYHFRISATNAGGTSRGADQALSTPAVPAVPQTGSGSQGVLPVQESKASPVPDAKLTSTSLTVSPAGVVSATVTCPTGESSCTGTIVLQTLNAVSAGATGHQSKQRKPAVLMLTRGSFTVAGGHSKTVTLRLSTGARALFARTHPLRVRATIAAHDPVGATHSAQAIVTLRALKATRHH